MAATMTTWPLPLKMPEPPVFPVTGIGKTPCGKTAPFDDAGALEHVSPSVNRQSGLPVSDAPGTIHSIRCADRKSEGQAVLGRQNILPTPWLTERHGYDPTSAAKRPPLTMPGRLNTYPPA